MNYIENFGLEFLTQDEESAMALCRAVCAQGKAIMGYYGFPYINHEYGWPQFIVRTKGVEDKKLTVTGMDTHLSGVTKWTFKIRHSRKACEDNDPLTRKVMAYKPADGSGAAMITLVNADVLPSFLEDEQITAQMIGFPVHINYYEDEDAYAADQPEMLNGNKMLLADGAVFPAGLMTNKEDKSDEEESFMLIRGTVKKAQRGLVEFGEEKGWNYLDVIIGTQFGDLEIVHTMEQVEESGRMLIKEGSIVSGLFVLSGDVAVDEYKEGIVKDYSHNLAALRYTIQEGEAERLGSILSGDAQYVSEWAKTTYCGKQEIIDRLNYVKEANPHRAFFTHFATITSVDEGEEELPYKVGDRCIIICLETEDNYESICFMECNDDNQITKIVVTRNSRYHFKVDEKVVYKDLYDFKAPDDWYDAITGRAHFHSFVDNEVAKEDIQKQASKTRYYECVSHHMVECMKATPAEDILDFLSKLFGHLFAKSVELELSNNLDFTYPMDVFNMSAIDYGYEPDEWDEYITKRLQASYELGKQFYKDFAFHREALKTEAVFEEDLEAALVFVQQIAEMYSKQKLKSYVEENE